MIQEELKELVHKQRRFFHTNATMNIGFRIQALEKLKRWIQTNEKEIVRALQKDLGKSSFESYMSEIGLVLSEIAYMQRHVAKYSKTKTVHTPLAQFHAKSFVKPSPYGVVLIMSPWNYPFLLTIDPLIDALAAGNTVILKPSAYSAYTSKLLSKMIQECFEERYVAVVSGGRAENLCLLEQHFDYIFFTGSQSVGKQVMKKASEFLTPVTLELGGKSPCIVDKSANIKLSVKRIVFGKYLNCGQTCVAPDYIYCDRAVKDKFVRELKKQIQKQYGNHPLENEAYGKIINKKHFERILNLIDQEKVVHGGNFDEKTLKIEPTILDHVTVADASMQEEIFGPVLPILTYDHIEEVIRNIQTMPKPLALYLFTKDKNIVRKVTTRCSFGGGCINDTIIHLATSKMPFGGVGESGMGSYHGKAGFDTFTHYKSMVDKKTWLDLPVRYQPYKKGYHTILRKILK